MFMDLCANDRDLDRRLSAVVAVLKESVDELSGYYSVRGRLRRDRSVQIAAHVADITIKLAELLVSNVRSADVPSAKDLVGLPQDL